MDSIHTPAGDATGPHRPPPAAERSLGELFRELSADGSRLVRQEIALARAEMRRNVAAATSHAGMVAVGAAMAVAGAMVLVAALVAFLGDVVLGERYWLAALLVGVVLLAGGGALAFLAVKRMGAGGVAPAETLAALRETSGWARAEVEDLREALSSGVVPHTSGNGRGAATPYLRLHTDGNGGEPAARAEASPERRGTGRGSSAGRRRVESKGKEAGPLPASEPLWKRVVHEFQEDDLTNQAAKVAYYFFLSLPPLMMALFGLAGIFGGQPTADWLTERLGRVLPTEAGGLVNDFVNQVVHQKAPGLLTVGLLLALWAAANVIMALEDTLNDAFEVTAERGFIQKRVTALAVLLGVSVLFLGGSVILLGGPALARAMGLGPTGDAVWSVLQWPLSFALVVGAFWVIYYFLPNKDQSGCKRTLLKSSALAAALWLVATAGFKLYIAHFSSYSATYGLLGTVIVLQLWMWMTSLVILLGGEISSEMERTA